MYVEIGVVAASRIPKGVLFGSLPTRLVKSENNDDGQKFGFIEVQYKNGKLFSQYGPQFNWMKYISASQDLYEQNLEACIDESGEISFETSQEIERGQELLYTFSKQHDGGNEPNQQQDRWSCKMDKCENLQDWKDRKHDIGCGGNKTNLKPGKKQVHSIEDNVHANVDNMRSGEKYGTSHASESFWLSSGAKDDSATTSNDQKNDRQLPWFSERLRMSRYHLEEKAGPYKCTRDDESLEATNGTKACQQNDANWYPLPIGVTRPLGCTCTWSQPYLPSRNHKAMYGAYVETRTNADEMPHGETLPDSHPTTTSHPTTSLRKTEVPKITLIHETFNKKEVSKSISQEQGKGSGNKMASDSPTRSEDLLRRISTPRLTNNGESNKATQVQESHTNVNESDNIAPISSPVATSPEHAENNQYTPTAEQTSEEKPTCESVEEPSSDAKEEEKSPSDQVRNGSRFVCDYCGKSYCRRYVLKIHMRTHTGHKPLHCTVCWKSFGDPSNLKKHVRSHARKNAIYTCEHCGRGSFYRLCDLVRHIKFRHRLASAEKWPSSSTTNAKKQD